MSETPQPEELQGLQEATPVEQLRRLRQLHARLSEQLAQTKEP